MAKEILLISAATVRTMSNISDNISDKYLLPAIREAQEMGLRNILGYVLLEKMKTLVASGKMEESGKYYELMDYIRYYLVYATIAKLPMTVGYKIANMGVVRTSDEKVESASASEIIKVSDHYQSQADAYAHRMQQYLCDQYSHFPELGQTKYNQIKANLHSAASSGLYLGGARGKKILR
jgi:hypothetical protein